MSADLLVLAEKSLRAAQAVLEAGVEGGDAAQTVAGVRLVKDTLELVRELRGEVPADPEVEGASFDASVEALLVEIAARGGGVADPWAVTGCQLQFLRDNGPGKAHSDEVRVKVDRVLRLASAALDTWGVPSEVAGRVASRGPVGLPEPLDDAEVVEDSPGSARAVERPVGAGSGMCVRGCGNVPHSGPCFRPRGVLGPVSVVR